MRKLSTSDGADSFDVALFEATVPTAVVLFSVGGGGSPERHVPLLTSLQESGCSVVAPYFPRLVSPVPMEAELLMRARRLRLALAAVAQAAPPSLPATGIGHSIGATMLLALAGAQMWMRAGSKLEIAPEARLQRLALMAPATDFFRAPGALDAVKVPMQVWAATKDVITPPAQAEFLRHALLDRVPIDMHVVPDADHFSFMNVRPPQTTEPLPNPDAFHAELAATIVRFVAGK